MLGSRRSLRTWWGQTPLAEIPAPFAPRRSGRRCSGSVAGSLGKSLPPLLSSSLPFPAGAELPVAALPRSGVVHPLSQPFHPITAAEVTGGQGDRGRTQPGAPCSLGRRGLAESPSEASPLAWGNVSRAVAEGGRVRAAVGPGVVAREPQSGGLPGCGSAWVIPHGAKRLGQSCGRVEPPLALLHQVPFRCGSSWKVFPACWPPGPGPGRSCLLLLSLSGPFPSLPSSCGEARREGPSGAAQRGRELTFCWCYRFLRQETA